MGELILLFCAFIWSLAYYFSKSAIAALPPNIVVLYRYALAAVCFVPFITFASLRDRLTLWYGTACGVVLWAILLLLYYGLQTGSIANAGFIVTLFIIFVPILSAAFLGGTFSSLDWLAIACAALGLWFVTGGIHGSSTADLLYLGAAFVTSFHVLLIERASAQVSDFVTLCFVQCVTVVVCSVLFACLMRESFPMVTASETVDLVFLGVLGSTLTLWLQVHGQKSVSAWRSCLIYATEPVFTAVIAWRLAGEQLSGQMLLGGFCIVVSILLPKLGMKKAPA